MVTTKATQPGRRMLGTSLEASRARKAYWARLRDSKRQGIPVVATVGFPPREILHAMGVPTLGMESLSIQASTKQLSAHYCEIAEQQGFARGLCAVHKALLGIAATEDRDPYVDSMFVKPDLIMGSPFPCNSESKSFLYWVERFGCPYHVVDVPINTWGNNIAGHAVEYLVGEYKQMIAFLEEHGFHYEPARLSQAVRNSRRTLELWREVEECRKAIPTPMTTVDGLSCIGYTFISLLGSDAAVELFVRLRDEVAARVKNGEGVIPDERLRLYLVGVPPMYNLGLLNYPEKYGAVVVKSDLDFLGGGLADPSTMDPDSPFEALARKQISDIANPCFANKIAESVRTVREYRIDGVIGLNKRGCRNLPAALRLVKDAVHRETGRPMMIMDLDGIDASEYNDSQVKSTIDSFMETLVQRKAGG